MAVLGKRMQRFGLSLRAFPLKSRMVEISSSGSGEGPGWVGC
jgi:hypothetical protein